MSSGYAELRSLPNKPPGTIEQEKKSCISGSTMCLICMAILIALALLAAAGTSTGIASLVLVLEDDDDNGGDLGSRVETIEREIEPIVDCMTVNTSGVFMCDNTFINGDLTSSQTLSGDRLFIGSLLTKKKRHSTKIESTCDLPDTSYDAEIIDRNLLVNGDFATILSPMYARNINVTGSLLLRNTSITGTTASCSNLVDVMSTLTEIKASISNISLTPGSPGTNGTDGTNGTNGTNGTDGAVGPPGPAFTERFYCLSLPNDTFSSDRSLQPGTSSAKFRTSLLGTSACENNNFTIGAGDTTLTVVNSGWYQLCITLSLDFSLVSSFYEAINFRAYLVVDGTSSFFDVQLATWPTNDDIISASNCILLDLPAASVLEWNLSNPTSGVTFVPTVSSFSILLTRYS